MQLYPRPFPAGNHEFQGSIVVNALTGSGIAAILNAISGSYGLQVQGNGTSGNNFGLNVQGGAGAADVAAAVLNAAATAIFLKIFGDGHGQLGPNATNDITWNTAGNFVLAAPTSGVAWSSSGAANAYVEQITGNSTSGQSLGQLIKAGTTSADFAQRIQSQNGGTDFAAVLGNGEAYIDEPAASTAPFGHQVGYLEVPINNFAVNYATVMTDRAKLLVHNSVSAHTLTINDTTVNYPGGAALVVENPTGQGVVTIALQTTAANLIWYPSGGTGNRTLTAPGRATIIKYDTAGPPAHWSIVGVNLT